MREFAEESKSLSSVSLHLSSFLLVFNQPLQPASPKKRKEYKFWMTRSVVQNITNSTDMSNNVKSLCLFLHFSFKSLSLPAPVRNELMMGLTVIFPSLGNSKKTLCCLLARKKKKEKKKLLLQLLNDLSSQVSERKAIGLVYAGWIFIRSSTRGCSLRENKGRHGNALVGDLRFISVTVNLSILIPFFAFFSLSRRWMSSHDSFHAFSTTLNQTSSLQGQSVPFFLLFSNAKDFYLLGFRRN